jgi:hypothetical protein
MDPAPAPYTCFVVEDLDGNKNEAFAPLTVE